jgi:hypothetical protein
MKDITKKLKILNTKLWHIIQKLHIKLKYVSKEKGS